MARWLQLYTTSRAQSCATCKHWRLEGPKSLAWCPRAAAWLPRDLTRSGCVLWLRETQESHAVEVWTRLTEGHEDA